MILKLLISKQKNSTVYRTVFLAAMFMFDKAIEKPFFRFTSTLAHMFFFTFLFLHPRGEGISNHILKPKKTRSFSASSPRKTPLIKTTIKL
jgi:hypothetical protein